jgi:hypothetical protein
MQPAFFLRKKERFMTFINIYVQFSVEADSGTANGNYSKYGGQNVALPLCKFFHQCIEFRINIYILAFFQYKEKIRRIFPAFFFLRSTALKNGNSGFEFYSLVCKKNKPRLC